MSGPANGMRGVLAPVRQLDRWLDAALLVLVAVCTMRYLARHPLDGAGVFVLSGAAVFAAAYAVRGRVRGRTWWPTAWILGVITLWAALTLVAPSFAWTAVPVAFATLRVLRVPYAAALVALMTLVVSLAWARLTDGVDPTIVAGPIVIAFVTVVAFHTLAREAAERQRLLDELTAAQDELASAERRAGAIAERTRLARDLHDSIGQGLTSINLMLQAAERDWDREPAVARDLVTTAAGTARRELDESRRVVQNLAATGLDGELVSGTALAEALRSAITESTGATTTVASLALHGEPQPVSPAIATALIRTVRGSLANVVEHADAGRVAVTLTQLPGEVLLDVRDDGRGFDPAAPPGGSHRGTGLRGIRQRAESLGGRVSLESAPGEGTAVSVALPVGTAT
ncbi:sensor histidine kinase [Nocardioides sp. GXZ039]|uniref:sensor histidine kinase n=1 Tax=Nocardioides sp. GXZ039 TaxID=3136018 RepID=UPI0030F48D84